MIDGDRLRQIRRAYLDVDDLEEKRARTQRLLDAMGIKSLNFIFKLERDGSNARFETLMKLAEALDVHPSDLVSDELTHAIYPDDVMEGLFWQYMRRVGGDKVDSIPEVFRDEFKALQEDKTASRELEFRVVNYASDFAEPLKGGGAIFKRPKIKLEGYHDALEVADNSLEPFASKGDYLVVSRSNLKRKEGDICVVLTKDEKQYIRRVYTQDDQYILQSIQQTITPFAIKKKAVEYVNKISLVSKNS